MINQKCHYSKFSPTHLWIVAIWEGHLFGMHLGPSLDMICTGHLYVWQWFLRVHCIHNGIIICIDWLLSGWHTQWHLVTIIIKWHRMHLALNLIRITVNVLWIVWTLNWLPGYSHRFIIFTDLIERTILPERTTRAMSPRRFWCYRSNFIDFLSRSKTVTKIHVNC